MIAGLPGMGLSVMFYVVLLVGMALANLGHWLVRTGRKLGARLGLAAGSDLAGPLPDGWAALRLNDAEKALERSDRRPSSWAMKHL